MGESVDPGPSTAGFEVERLRVVTDVQDLARARGWPYSILQEAGEEWLRSSEALPEDEERSRAGGELVTRHHYAGSPAGAKSVERWCVRLHTSGAQRLPETFVCEIPDGLLVGSLGIVVTARWEVLSQSDMGAPPASAMVWVLKDAEGPLPPTSPGTYASLLTFASRSYGHWLLDSLPRVLPALAIEPECRFVVPADPPRFQLEALRMLGVGESRIVRQRTPVLRAERLLLVHTARNLTEPRARHLLELRDRLLAAVHAGARRSRATERIWVTRSGATRPLVNEAELEPLLEEFGFRIVESRDLSFEDQVDLFSRARVVAGAHGAGLHNHIFHPGAATVVEVFNPRLWTPSVLRTASICGHRHAYVFGENVGNKLETRVDPGRLARLLERLL